MNKPLKGFITYSHEDTDAKDKLRRWLAVMEQQNKLVTWHDAEMIGGDTWSEDIFKNLADSDLLLYLVSAASLESKNCNKELAEALRSEIRVIPLILESCDWQNHQLSDFQALPDGVLPINKWQPESDGWQNVVDGIRKVVEKMQTNVEKRALPEWVFQQGNFLMMHDEFDKAIEAYSHAINLSPNNAAAYTNRAGAYGKKDEHDHAIEDCDKAIQLNSDDPYAYYNRGTAYGKKGEVDRAILDFTKAIEFKPNEADIYSNRGAAYNINGEVDRAIADFTRAIQLNPDDSDPDVYYNRGTAFGKKGEVDRAILDFTKVIEIKPDDVEALNNRGAANAIKGEVDRAIADFNKAIALNPNLAKIYDNRGKAYFQKKDFGRAIRDYTKAIQLNPTCHETYIRRGAVYHKKRNYDKAISDFTNAIKLNPSSAELYYIRGEIHSDKDDYGRSILDYTDAIRLKPDYAEAYQNRGLAYGIKGEINLAIEDFTRAIASKPEYPQAYYNRGLAYDINGEFNLAIEDYTKTIQLKPDDANAYHNRGSAYAANGNFDRAIENFTQAIELEPELAGAFYSRGVMWLYLREWESAKSDLTSARDKGLDIIAAFHNHYKNVKAYEIRHRVKLPTDIADILTHRRRGRFPKSQKFLRPDGTPYESPDVLNLLEKLCNAGSPLSEYVQTRPTFGFKIGLGEAFVVDGETRDRLIAEHSSSGELLKPFLHGRDIRRWKVARPDAWLIFSYRRIEINRYPAIRNHLEKYRSPLSKRAGKQKWYELPAAKADVERFTQTKLICPNSYNHQTFAVDTEGFYCGDTCYLIPTAETWLCGLLNSRVVEWFYSQTSNQLTGDYLRARSRYIQQIPIPELTPTQKSLIGKIVDYLIYLQGQPTTSGGDLAHARDAVMLGYFERIIDGLVYESYLREELHHGDKHVFKPLLEEGLPQIEEIRGDEMPALREIFERLYERTHPVRSNLFFLDSAKPIRIIEGKA